MAGKPKLTAIEGDAPKRNVDEQLKAIADRVENRMDEIDEIRGDIREIYAEAKSLGYNVPALRRTIADKRKDQEKLKALAQEVALYSARLGYENPFF